MHWLCDGGRHIFQHALFYSRPEEILPIASFWWNACFYSYWLRLLRFSPHCFFGELCLHARQKCRQHRLCLPNELQILI